MVAVADEQALHSLTFGDHPEIPAGNRAPLCSIEQELQHYFAGRLRVFITPLVLQGTPFQKRVWEALLQIPYGRTLSYAALAAAIGRPTAFRAVAQANSANRIAIVIPCHRVINASGALGGYNSGIQHKEWLLKREGILTNALE